jgi:sarcosine oxidase
MKDVTQADIVIVGGGLLGLGTAYALRGRREVLVLERDTIGNTRAGSHGPTRIFRLGYIDPRYVAMAMEAAELWRMLEAETGAQLLHPTPQLTFGPGADAVYRALASLDLPVERITATEIERRFPAFAGRGDAVLETTSAVIAADRTLQALREHSGADVREHVRVEAVDAHHVETADEIIEAQAVVVCAGPWSRSLLPGLQTTTTL